MTGWQQADCDSSACISVHVGLTDVTIRDTERPDQVIVASLESWRAFREAVKRGEFDEEGAAVGE